MKKVDAFTLAEVLVTLGVLGILAAMTIGILQNVTDNGFKVAYKKAYSDMSQAFAQSLADGSLQPRSTAYWDWDATASEWAVIKNAFKVVKDCLPEQLDSCWFPNDLVCNGTCGYPSPASSHASNSFVDASGRSWAEYDGNENFYVIDTNGLKPPNRFGKDRWVFTFRNTDGSRTKAGLPAKVGIYPNSDQLTKGDWCQYPPCNYYSWLYN